MKKFVLCISVAMMAFVTMISGADQTKAERENARKSEVQSKIDGRDYTIDVNIANPTSGRTISLTSNYSVQIKGDSIYSYLPYYGRAYSLPYGGGEGLRFKGKMSDYTVAKGKKGATSVKFSVRTNEDRYTFGIDIFSNGTTSMWVTPMNKQSISFHGAMKLDEPKKR